MIIAGHVIEAVAIERNLLLITTCQGIVGKKTIAALNAQDPKGFFDEVQKARLEYTDDIIQSSIRRYENRIGRTASPQERKKYTNLKYEKGWKRRSR